MSKHRMASVFFITFALIGPVNSAPIEVSESEIRAFLEQCKRTPTGKCKSVATAIKLEVSNSRAQATTTPPPNPKSGEPEDKSTGLRPPKEVINKFERTVLVRDSFVPIAYITAPSASGDDLPQEGAQFTYTHKLRDSSNTFVGKGAVMLAFHGNTDIPLSSDYLGPRVTYVNIAPGIDFDTTIKNGKSSGQYSAIAGLEVETTHSDPNPFNLQYWRANAVYTTDFDQNAQILGVEAMWQPWAPSLWIGSMQRVSEKLDMWFGFFPTVASDYYHVNSAGTFKDLAHEQYWWVGPKVSAKVAFLSGYLKPFSAYANYYYLYDTINGGGAAVDYFKGGIKYQLTEGIGLEWRYTSGTTPRTLARVNEFYTGLTLKVGELR